jgi:hypothetical protein
MKVFDIERIAIDTQGGGVAIIEALQDKTRLEIGEQQLWETIVEDKPKESDGYAGLHVLELVNFARAEWVSEANHGMRKDFEDKTLLFPEFNSAIVGLALEQDKAQGLVVVDTEDRIVEQLYDTLDDCVAEIEELKDEVASIVHTQTANKRDHWDTPETKLPGGKKGRLRKDRYSALLMANMSARSLQRAPVQEEYEAMGGFARQIVKAGTKAGGGRARMWNGPAWWTNGGQEGGDYGCVVVRGRGVSD